MLCRFLAWLDAEPSYLGIPSPDFKTESLRRYLADPDPYA